MYLLAMIDFCPFFIQNCLTGNVKFRVGCSELMSSKEAAFKDTLKMKLDKDGNAEVWSRLGQKLGVFLL